MDKGSKESEQNQDAAGWTYRSESGVAAAASERPEAGHAESGPGAIKWSASEFVQHDKGLGWYIALVLIVLALDLIVYLVTRDVFSAIIILVFGFILALAAGRKPRTQTYRLDASGVSVGSQHHSYNEYKSFACFNEGPFWSIVFLPMKRFALPLSIYMAPEQEQDILDMLSEYLPQEKGELGTIEQLAHRLRF